VSAAAGIRDEREMPLPPPWPARGSGRLSRRQSIVAWVLGGLIGLVLAAALIAVAVGLV
jgi:hypothetical protein